MKQFITVALKIEYNENDNPYPVQDNNYRPKPFNTLQEAQEYSDKMFDMYATHTIIVEYERA